MAARASWAGAFSVGGVPIPVKVFTLAPAGRQSFKSLCPCHKEPIEQHKHCPVTQDVIEHEDLVKGVMVGSGKNATVVPLDDDAIDQLKELTEQRTVMADILKLPPADTIPWHLAVGRYRVVPDEKAVGSEKSLNILWNGLWATGRALVTQWIKRKGSAPTLAVLRADEHGLTAIELPYATAVRDDDPTIPEFTPELDEQAQQVFSMFIQMQDYDTGDFDHDEFTDTVAERRDELVMAAMGGAPMPKPSAPAAAPSGVPDLMAALTASLAHAQAGGTPSAPAAPKPAKKAAKPAAPKPAAPKVPVADLW